MNDVTSSMWIQSKYDRVDDDSDEGANNDGNGNDNGDEQRDNDDTNF